MKTLSEASNLLNSGKISSIELTKECLALIEAKDTEIGSFLQIAKDSALESAKLSDERRQSGQALGPLDGIPVAVKDIIFCKGLESTAASKILEGYVAPYDSGVIKYLKKSGAIILGKLNQDEFAMGASGEHSAYKICRNPLDLERTPGGSSSGSAAAVAAGMAYGSLGTDTGGSVRQPASFCGIVGMKPTYGRISRQGVIAFASSLDQVGVFGRSVEDTALMLGATAGYDPNDSTSVDRPVPDYQKALTGDISGKKFGVPKEYFTKKLNPEVKACLQNAIKALEAKGAIAVDISLPTSKAAVATYYIIATAEASSNLARYDGIRFGPRKAEDEGLNALYSKTRGELFGTEVKRRILLGTYVLSAGYYDAYYVRAQKVRALISQDFKKAFEKVDFIITPTAPKSAYKIGAEIDDPLEMYLEDLFTIPVNMAGLPGISVPAGKSSNGMPIGAQLIGKPFMEEELLNSAFALESELNA